MIETAQKSWRRWPPAPKWTPPKPKAYEIMKILHSKSGRILPTKMNVLRFIDSEIKYEKYVSGMPLTRWDGYKARCRIKGLQRAHRDIVKIDLSERPPPTPTGEDRVIL